LPLRPYTIKRKFQPKLPVEISNYIVYRDRLRKLAYNFSQNANIFERYKNAKNRVKQMVATFQKSVIYNKIASLQRSTQIWSKLRDLGLIKEKANSNDLPVSLDEMVEGLTIVQSDAEIEKIEFDYQIYKPLQGEKFYFKHVEPLQVYEALCEITSSAEGNDGICIKMLKGIILIILPTITNIINSSLQMSIFPRRWKRALICPIPKIRTPTTIKDFRPISLLCTLSKVLEKIVFSQLAEYVGTHGVFDPLQSGYRKMHSTATALLKITEDIRRAIFNKDVTLIVCLDYSKAFDTVNHKLLINKLRQMNLSNSVIRWFESYLAEREHAVRGKKGTASKWTKLQCGVPQGSVLAPFLYSLFTHDMCRIFQNRCKYHVYADDVQLYISCKPSELSDAIGIMNCILDDVFKWSQKHGLKLNPTKTQAMVIATHIIHKKIDFSNLPHLILNSTQIEFTDNVKNLGVIFDKYFKWDKHVSTVCQKVYGVLTNLQKFRDVTPEPTRLQLFKSLILPHFDYCSYVYCNINAEQTKRLQSALTSAMRYVYNVPFAANMSPFYVKAQVLKIKERSELEILLITHKILYENCPKYLTDLVCKISDVNARKTRSHKLKLRAPLAGVEAAENSFRVKCYRLWNDLPTEICLNPSITAFKRLIFNRYLCSYA
jgi:retron-type reverse transcriptase